MTTISGPLGTLTVEGLDGIRKGLREAPAVTYFWMRDAFGQMAGKHRQQFLRNTGIRLRRGKGRISVARVNESPANAPDSTIVYRVEPEAKRDRSAPLNRIRLDIGTNSEALLAHEVGLTIRPRNARMLAVPITPPGGKAPGRKSPRKFRETMRKSSELITIRGRRGQLLLVERKRRRGRPDVLIPRWRLVAERKLPPSLKFLETWDALRPERDRVMADRADRIVRDIARGMRD